MNEEELRKQIKQEMKQEMKQEIKKEKKKINRKIIEVVVISLGVLIIGVMCNDMIIEKKQNKYLMDKKNVETSCNHCKKSKNDIDKENGLCKECFNFFWANGNFSMIEYFKNEQKTKQKKIEEENRKSVENLIKDNYDYENGYLIPKE